MTEVWRKAWVFTLLVWGGIQFGNAQELGLRFGDVPAGSVAVDAIFSAGDFKRLHADLSFGNGVAADLLWDCIYRPVKDEAFNWYMGVGPYLAIYDKKVYENGTRTTQTDFNLGLAYEVGIEYHFVEIPLVMGIDYRPALEIVDRTSLHWGGFGFNARYVF